jgi:hypothetical protein
MEVWSALYLTDPTACDGMTAACSAATWRRIHEENEGAKRIFGRIRADDRTWVVALGSPFPAQEGLTDTALVLPGWMLDHLGLNGGGDLVEMDWFWEDAFPEATRILLRPHDSAFYHGEAKEELERELTKLGVLTKGSTIVVPLQVLGGYEVAIDVVELEPANIVLAEGEEVALEFEEALDASGAMAPVAPPLATSEAFGSASMVPDAVALEPAPGHRLGGEVRRMPDGRPWNPWRV